MTYLFSNEFNEKAISKFYRKPEWNKPWIYKFVTEPDDSAFGKKRNEIESFLDQLDCSNREKFFKKFNDDLQGFLNIFHELGVGIQFKKLGFNIYYEKKFGSLTPDWFISDPENKQGFIVDVYTSSLDKNNQKLRDMFDDLSTRLSEIPIGVELEATWKGSPESPFPIDKSKMIKEEVHKWLLSKPHEREKNNIYDICFKIESYSSYLTNVFCVFETEHFSNMEGELKKIKKKVSSYKNCGYPLIVVVVVHTTTLRSGFQFFRLLIGDIVYDLQDKKLKLIRNQVIQKLDDKLSAVLRTWAFGLSNWEFEVYRIPNAQVKVPENLFGKDYRFSP